jgi:hypothetical protein
MFTGVQQVFHGFRFFTAEACRVQGQAEFVGFVAVQIVLLRVWNVASFALDGRRGSVSALYFSSRINNLFTAMQPGPRINAHSLLLYVVYF